MLGIVTVLVPRRQTAFGPVNGGVVLFPPPRRFLQRLPVRNWLTFFGLVRSTRKSHT